MYMIWPRFVLGSLMIRQMTGQRYVEFLGQRQHLYPNPLPRPLMTATTDQWRAYRQESGHRLQPGDPGYVVWALVKQDLLEVVQTAVDNECDRVFGTTGMDGLPAPGSNIIVGGPIHTTMMASIVGRFPITLEDL